MTATDITASRELFRRGLDDRYEGLPSMLAAAQLRQQNSRELSVPASALIFTPTNAAPGAHPFELTVDHLRARSLPRVRLTHYALSQLCSASRVPIELLQRISPRTACAVLNESIRSDRTELSDRQLLLDTTDADVPSLRALTSEKYARVWDADVFGRVQEWLAPLGYVPATPTRNTVGGRDVFGDKRPFLWSGDRDSFGLFYTAPDQNGADFGGLRRGIYVGNSEVGAATLSWSTFLFRDVCANAIIWDVAQQKRRRVRHVGQTGRVFAVYCREVQRLAREIEPLPLKEIAAAAKRAFVGDGSLTDSNRLEATAKLARLDGVSRSQAQGAVDAVVLPVNAARPGEPALSYWTIAQGITWDAKTDGYGARVVEAGKVAQELILAGAAG